MQKITVIGAGEMGGAICVGLKAIDANIVAADPNKTNLQRLADKGIKVTADNAEAVCGADCVIVVVKPAIVGQVLKEIAPHLKDCRDLCVVAGGMTAAQLQALIANAGIGDIPNVSLAIPNTAVALCQGVTFVHPVTGKVDAVKNLFEAVGAVYVVDEQLLGAGMHLASCGLAYALRYVRAASEGGVQLGFRADTAAAIVAQTMVGAAAILRSTGMHPEAAVDQVTTPGGITIRGLNAMEAAGFTPAVISGIISD